MYEMMTGTLPFRLLPDDAPYNMGALLTRLAAASGAEELVPLLRLLERDRALAADMPKYKETPVGGHCGLPPCVRTAPRVSASLDGLQGPQGRAPDATRPPERRPPNILEACPVASGARR